METITYSSTQFSVRDSKPYLHTDHEDGEYSIKLTGVHDAFAVYLHGTPKELSDFVGRLSVAVVAAHDAARLAAEGELSA